MRPLTVIPRYTITELALSPDGRQLGVVQPPHGFRLLDTVTGSELARDTERPYVFEESPTGRHTLSAPRTAVRLAEVVAGKPFLRFQTGWTRAGNHNWPPGVPETSALPSGAQICWSTLTQRGSTRVPAQWHELSGGALTADHRFAVGYYSHGSKYAVRDLDTEQIVATLDLSAVRMGTSGIRTTFTLSGTRIIAASERSIATFDLPLDSLSTPVTRSAPISLTPVGVISVTQPQPVPGVSPFAVLPCGKKAIVRGEKSRIELRDLTTGEVLTVWRWGLQRANAVAVAADGLTAAAGGIRGQVVIWDLE